MGTKEIIIFLINEMYYGVEVKELQSIENYSEPNKVAGSPEYMPGIVTIRKEIYPVIDLRTKFVAPQKEVTDHTKYIILKTNAGKVACLVDRVMELCAVTEDMVQPFPFLLVTPKTSYADFVVHVKENLVLVVDANHLFNSDETAEMALVQDNIES